MIFKILEIFVKLVDKHDKGRYVNDDDQDNKDGIHETFCDVIERI